MASCPALIAYTGELPPFNYFNENKKLVGITIDVLKTISERAGCPVTEEQIQIISWPRAVQDVEDDAGKMIFSLGRTDSREIHYQWVGPVGTLRLGLIARKDNHIIVRRPHDLQGKRIGVIRNSAPVSLLNTMLGTQSGSLNEMVTNEQQFHMLEAGRVDMISVSAAAVPTLATNMHLDPKDYEMVCVLKELELYIALSPKAPVELVVSLQRELDRLKEPGTDGVSEYDDIVSHYLVNGETPLADNVFILKD